MFLYEKINAWREGGLTEELPLYIMSNLNPNFELRRYQKEAFESFITYFKREKCPRPTQVLFHMATGSGKTLIMAGLMLYLYKRGYRNFLFFVNLSNIVEKTKENFLNPRSTKYLFSKDIIIDGEHVRIKQVDNFQYTDRGAINICFTTTQGLHMDMLTGKENSMSYDDFDEREVVFISDEAHHLNVDTKKKLSEEEDFSRHTWEQTVRNIFERNSGNVLLEFTATCDLRNSAIRSSYENKIVFDYALAKYYEDKYSKDILTLRTLFHDKMDRALLALVISQYRLKVFQENGLEIKPVVLFKSAKITDSKEFMERFLSEVKVLNGERLKNLISENKSEIVHKAREYFSAHSVDFNALAVELQNDFSEEHCVSVNDETEIENKQILLNSLEDDDNPYRAIFEVKKLDEGWDVLNLFDIVRLYENKSSGKKISPSTVSEAQLIGRGARYCPFCIKGKDQPKYQRKYDNDVGNELRVCETLFYHCQSDSKYINELHEALSEIGIDIDERKEKREYVLKEEFKSDPIYQRGLVFLNRREEKTRDDVHCLPPTIRDDIYRFDAVTGVSASDKIMEDNYLRQDDVSVPSKMTSLSIKQIATINYAIVNKVLMKFQNYKFSTLKSYFPHLESTRQFILSDDYLGSVKIEIQTGDGKLTPGVLYSAAFYALKKIDNYISGIDKTYIGTKEFRGEPVRNAFHNRIVKYTETRAGSIGFSQNDPSLGDDRVDLSKEDWFVYTDNFGTSEEKAFVAYFKRHVEELKKTYRKVYLVRNEQEVSIYSFDDGARFQPDYVLFLQREKTGRVEQMQVFVEPKGLHLTEKDAWKEKFLLRLKKESIFPVELIDDGNDYRIWGLHFFNRDPALLKKFDEDFSGLMEP